MVQTVTQPLDVRLVPLHLLASNVAGRAQACAAGIERVMGWCAVRKWRGLAVQRPGEAAAAARAAEPLLTTLLTHGQEVGHGAAAQAALLPAAAHLGLHAHAGAAPDVDRADALGAIQLVARDGQQVDVHGVDVDGDLAHRLARQGRGSREGAGAGRHAL